MTKPDRPRQPGQASCGLQRLRQGLLPRPVAHRASTRTGERPAAGGVALHVRRASESESHRRAGLDALRAASGGCRWSPRPGPAMERHPGLTGCRQRSSTRMSTGRSSSTTGAAGSDALLHSEENNYLPSISRSHQMRSPSFHQPAALIPDRPLVAHAPHEPPMLRHAL